jgi:hypothetical protein
MGKAHKLSDWIPIDANAAINMAKKPAGMGVAGTYQGRVGGDTEVDHRQRQWDSTVPLSERVHCNADGSATLLQHG